MKAGIASGDIDIVVGTHALLAESIKFRDLGLLIIDEEQHFGVKHKERLKEMRTNVHVLTLTATPIPRTLQLALVRRARTLAHHHAAAGPPGGPHLHHALRPRHHPREPAARAFPRRPELLCRAARHRPRRDRRLPAREGAGGEVPHGAWPHAADRARRHHDRLLRPQVRRAALDHHRRIRPRHLDRQHADHPPRRHVRPGPALPAPWPRRAARSSAPMRSSPRPPTRRSPPPPTSASRCCSRSTRWARASRWPATTSTCAARATCWATSSRATSRKWATSSTSR